jgi:hypothetical protein
MKTQELSVSVWPSLKFSTSPSLSLYIFLSHSLFLNIHVCVCVCVCVSPSLFLSTLSVEAKMEHSFAVFVPNIARLVGTELKKIAIE